MTALGSALDTIERASASVDRTASRLAQATSLSSDGGDTVDLSAEMLALVEARNSTAIGVKIAQSVDDLQKTTLDILA